MKKIESIKVKRLIDDDPDTSYLGEYSDSCEEFAIDRREGEFVFLLEKPVDGCPDCEEATKDNEEPTQCREHEYDPPSKGREYRYFIPSSNHVPYDPKNWDHVPEATKAELIAKHGSLENVCLDYARQDFRRMESLNNGNWFYIGIVAEAKIAVKLENSWKADKLTSGGLWGIESDSDKAYLKEVTEEQLAELKKILKEYGFTSKQINRAFEDVESDDYCTLEW